MIVGASACGSKCCSGHHCGSQQAKATTGNKGNMFAQKKANAADSMDSMDSMDDIEVPSDIKLEDFGKCDSFQCMLNETVGNAMGAIGSMFNGTENAGTCDAGGMCRPQEANPSEQGMCGMCPPSDCCQAGMCGMEPPMGGNCCGTCDVPGGCGGMEPVMECCGSCAVPGGCGGMNLDDLDSSDDL